jgi:hypothetical protein
MNTTQITTPLVWVRLGDTDNYNRFDDLAEAAEYMALFGVKHVYRCRKYGVEANGLTGLNYISLFFGDAQAQPTADLTSGEIKAINGELRKLARLTGGHRP